MQVYCFPSVALRRGVLDEEEGEEEGVLDCGLGEEHSSWPDEGASFG